ncbi:hypothetical protein K1719_013826 [Acacia pycnantha]|nr:hypothetical protein K1719_013826 [Acacia pycnantha]
MLGLLGLLLWYCMKNLILNQDALPPLCFSHIQATLFYCLVHPLVGNTRCCHHPHQKNQVHCTLFLPQKESIKLGWHKKGNLISLKNWLRPSVRIICQVIDLLQEITLSPQIFSEVDATFKAKQMKTDVDEYLKVASNGLAIYKI